jgi:ATP-binding cassette subfamily C protein
MLKFLNQLLDLFSEKEKKQLFLIWLMMAFGALIETAGVGAIPAFIAVLSEPDRIRHHRYLVGIFDFLRVGEGKQLIATACFGLALLFLLKNLYLLALQYVQTRFSYRKMSSLACSLFEIYLRKPITFHFSHNTAELQHNIGSESASIVTNLISPLMSLLTECMIVFFVAILLLIVDPLTSVASMIVLGISVFAFYRLIRRSVARNGQDQQRYGKEMIKWLNQGLGAVKEAKILGRESFFVDAFSVRSRHFTRSIGFVQIANQAPRLFIETLAILALTGMVIAMINQPRTVQSVLPTLTLFAVAAIRLMPSVSRIISLATVVRYHKRSLDAIYPELRLGLPLTSARTDERLSFRDAICIEGLAYTYPGSDAPALNGISLTIRHGQSIGLVGPSGGGKSTLVDVLLGLLQPHEGKILADGIDIRGQLEKWQRNMGYVPQAIYLTDDTIRRNVAFGVVDENIDDKRVRKALQSAQLEGFVDALPEGLNTEVGERGVRLSGGQRQRIGIARALYDDPEILIMDEATAALDNNTEREITVALEGLSQAKTIIVIAHRLSTVRNCDVLFYIECGQIVASGSYENLLRDSAKFAQLAAQ